MNVSEKFLLESERRFKETCELQDDISFYPILNTQLNVKTNKEKSKKYSEVFTPLWLVDSMIGQANYINNNSQTLDLCAGYGQFSIRLLRYLYNTYPNFKPIDYLKNNHAFSELQLSSCYKLLNHFGININLFIGDAIYLNKLPNDAKGIWVYISNYGYWVNLTKTIQKISLSFNSKNKSISESKFVELTEKIIQTLNKVYLEIKEMYNQSLEEMKVYSKLRKEWIRQRTDANPDSLQNVNTPYNLIKDMVDCVDNLENKKILVLFNSEIVEHLIHKKKIDPSNITFCTNIGDKIKAKFVEKMYGVDCLLDIDGKFTFIHNTFKGRIFDTCLTNPPYNKGLDLKILQSLIRNFISKEYVIVHPSTWLLDRKGKSVEYVSFKKFISNKLKSVKLFNGNPIFDISLFVPCAISHIDININNNMVDVSYFDDKFTAPINEITKFGSNYSIFVKPFLQILKNHINKYGNVWAHNEKQIDSQKYYCQLSAIIGTAADLKDGKYIGKMVKDDFYTLTRITSTNKNADANKLNKPGNPVPTFGFISEVERDNFLLYLNTDFARFCLSLLKNNLNVSVGEMEMIPWLDFNQAWDDQKLFNYFNIDQKTQDYIRSFLPDYYGIRK